MNHQLLAGKFGIITGALNQDSLAWKVAEKAYSQGAKFVLTNVPVSIRLGSIDQLASNCETIVIPADASKIDEVENLLKSTLDHFGQKVDFILHSIGMSPNVRKNRPYTDLNYDFLLKTLDISAISFHKLLQSAMKLDAINEWGSVLGLSYIAAQRTFPGYNDMAEAKALLESICRSYGYHYGIKKNVRINTISQSPTITTAGSGVDGFDKFLDYAEKMSPLGNASAEDCANYCIMMFSDYTRMITMQNLYHDGGFSSVGVSEKLMDMFE